MSINAPAAPGPLPDGPPHQQGSPGAARDHARRLHQDGRTYQAIATTAGLAPATVSGLATGRRRPTRGTTTAILAVTSATVPRGRVDASGTRLRLRALHVMGHGSARHRPRPRRPRDRGQPARPRRRPHHQAEAAQRGRRPVRRVVGQACPYPHPRRARRRRHRPPQGHRRELVRPRRPRRRPARHPRLPAPIRLEARHRHRRRPRHPPARPPAEEDPPMTSDHRITPGLITDVLDALKRHDYIRGDDLHAERVSPSSATWPTSTEAPRIIPPSPITMPPSPPAYPGASRHDAAALTRADASTVFAALDIAADDKRYRVEMCPDCPDQSCPTCQTHLDARAFDQMADRMLQAVKSSRTASASRTRSDRGRQAATDREAGQ